MDGLMLHLRLGGRNHPPSSSRVLRFFSPSAAAASVRRGEDKDLLKVGCVGCFPPNMLFIHWMGWFHAFRLHNLLPIAN